MGNLESLPSFTVRGIPHYFIGYQLGDFDRERFMSELKKVVSAAVDMFGDIPYRHYTFLAIGAGKRRYRASELPLPCPFPEKTSAPMPVEDASSYSSRMNIFIIIM